MCLRRQLDAERTENARLQNALGKKADSIWAMNKADLVAKARLDLGMTKAQSERETVTTLRERLRSQKEMVEHMSDPLCKIPKGLDSMRKEVLTQECFSRGIHIVEPSTRPKMILAIRDDVMNRTTMSQHLEECEMPDAESSDRCKRQSHRI